MKRPRNAEADGKTSDKHYRRARYIVPLQILSGLGEVGGLA